MKILIVDDIKGWRDYHAQYLNKIFDDPDIYFSDSARNAYDLLIEHHEKPFDIILTDMKMENDLFIEPEYAGEWLIKQIKTFKSYNRTKIVVISATYNIAAIAQNYGVNYIRKSTARSFPDVYLELKTF